MIKFTAKQIVILHEVVKSMYPGGVTGGRVNRSMLASIAERPFRSVYGHAHYDTIFKQAACLMEGIIRFHPFPDGNKRTALLVTHIFMALNKNYMVMPLDVVRFMVDVAQNDARTDEAVDELINRMAEWLKKRTATDYDEYNDLAYKYIGKPVWKMLLLSFTGVGIIYVRRKFRHWLASDMHPEYDKNSWQTVLFLLGMVRRTGKMIKAVNN